MTGRGHRLTGVGAAFIAAAVARLADLPEVAAAAVALFSTTIPDWIEIPFYRQGQRIGSLIPHRTVTHWPWLWLGLAAWSPHLGTWPGALLLGACVGALTHIAGDAPNPMGIPWVLPHRRLRIGRKGLWRSGQHEVLIVTGFTLVGYGCWRLVGGVLPLG